MTRPWGSPKASELTARPDLVMYSALAVDQPGIVRRGKGSMIKGHAYITSFGLADFSFTRTDDVSCIQHAEVGGDVGVACLAGDDLDVRRQVSKRAVKNLEAKRMQVRCCSCATLTQILNSVFVLNNFESMCPI